MFLLLFFLNCSGLGYILGAQIATATGDWRWALRVRLSLKKKKFHLDFIILHVCDVIYPQ